MRGGMERERRTEGTELPKPKAHEELSKYVGHRTFWIEELEPEGHGFQIRNRADNLLMTKDQVREELAHGAHFVQTQVNHNPRDNDNSLKVANLHLWGAMEEGPPNGTNKVSMPYDLHTELYTTCSV